MQFKKTLMVSAVLAMASTAMAQFGQRDLGVGSDAPELSIAEWIKGDPVTIEQGQVYVIEFWATWCPPCLRSIPHLTELQAKHGDKVKLVGISDEDVDTIRPFVNRMGRQMEYTVAADDSKKTFRAWMNAARQSGIPCAFIVGQDRKIAWIGNPLDPNFGNVLGLVVENRYDPKLIAEAEPLLEQARLARRVQDWRMAMSYFDQVIEKNAVVFNRVSMERIRMLINDMNDVNQAIAYMRGDFQQNYAQDPITLQLAANMILRDPQMLAKDERMPQVALELADAAHRADLGSPSFLATLALATFHNGDAEKAIRLQRDAFFKAKPADKPEYQRQLESFQRQSARMGR